MHSKALNNGCAARGGTALRARQSRLTPRAELNDPLASQGAALSKGSAPLDRA